MCSTLLRLLHIVITTCLLSLMACGGGGGDHEYDAGGTSAGTRTGIGTGDGGVYPMAAQPAREHPLSVNVTGLEGVGLVLQSAAGEALHVAGDGSFTFRTPVASGANPKLKVMAQPVGPIQTCTVSNDTPAVTVAAVVCRARTGA